MFQERGLDRSEKGERQRNFEPRKYGQRLSLSLSLLMLSIAREKGERERERERKRERRKRVGNIALRDRVSLARYFVSVRSKSKDAVHMRVERSN